MRLTRWMLVLAVLWTAILPSPVVLHAVALASASSGSDVAHPPCHGQEMGEDTGTPARPDRPEGRTVHECCAVSTAALILPRLPAATPPRLPRDRTAPADDASGALARSFPPERPPRAV